MIVNNQRGNLRCTVAKAPGFGDNQKDTLEDIAIFTGGQLVTEKMGRKLASASFADFGRARRIVVTGSDTTIIEGYGDRAALDARVAALRAQAEAATSDYDREKLQGRLSKLAGAAAVIRVGGVTEAEVKERKDRVDDAVHAARAAAQEGIIPGGGVSLLRAASAIEGLNLTGDERTGANIVKKALEAPLIQIAENAGREGSVVVAAVRREQQKTGDPNIGFEVVSGEFVDLLQNGIIDPLKVTRAALQNASSVAAIMLTTEAIVAELPEDEPPMPAMPDMDDY